MSLDVYRGRRVELARPRAVACLPDWEQLGQHAAVAGCQGRSDVEERVRKRTRDLVPVEVIGTRHYVALVRLKPLVVVGRDPETENVDGLLLLCEPRCQLLG